MKTTFLINNILYRIPDRMVPGIERYINDHIRPGRFLQAVICNDLKESFGRADDENFENIAAYVAFFYNEAPGDCWGSKQKMESWINNHPTDSHHEPTGDTGNP